MCQDGSMLIRENPSRRYPTPSHAQHSSQTYANLGHPTKYGIKLNDIRILSYILCYENIVKSTYILSDISQ